MLRMGRSSNVGVNAHRFEQNSRNPHKCDASVEIRTAHRRLLGKIGCISNTQFMGTAIVNLKVGIFLDSIPENILSQYGEKKGMKTYGSEIGV